ncbi:MAG: MFS transporter [candidate division KSB1 bacterium]|jgi:dipeptide/tripeptide permease|nr:MFS transporter [candidate division KSB1 bacterium]
MTDKSTENLTWRYPGTFWVANGIELFERAAYYGMFIALTLYLTREVGFSDVETGWVVAYFASTIYLAPTFTGALSDKIGFRNGLMLAFGLLTFGYALLGAVPEKLTAILSLTFIMIGGAFVKPIISGTVAKCSDSANRARAFAIFYQIVNIGAFLGKTIAKPLRTELGLKYINFYAAGMALIALILVALFYKNVDTSGVGKSTREVLNGLLRVVRNLRFMALILIVAGFWAIQGQLYATMPKYTLRMVGEAAAPEWLANINPFIVVLFVVPITHLIRKRTPVTSIAIALFIIPISAFTVSLSPLIQAAAGNSVSIFGLFSLHPVTIALIVGIALQGLAECFLSPRFLEFASKQAPKGEEGLYMGYQHLTTFFAWLFGFAISGYLLETFCPDPTTLSETVQRQRELALQGLADMPQVYENAHHIWYVFTGIGLIAFVSLLIYKWITAKIDNDT